MWYDGIAIRMFHSLFGPAETPVLFIAMHNYYRDDTAWIAIANVMRQQKREEWIREHQKPPVEKKERLPGPTVDVKRILASGHAIIHINRAEWAYRKMLRSIEENKENDR